MGVDIGALRPGKPGERIVKKDVVAQAGAAKPQPAVLTQPAVPAGSDVLEVIPMSGTRKVIAARMRQSNVEQPSAALTLTAHAEGMVRPARTLQGAGHQNQL